MVESEDGLEESYIEDCLPELLELSNRLDKIPKETVPRLSRQLENVRLLLEEQGVRLKQTEKEMLIIGAIHQTNGLSILDVARGTDTIGHCLAVSAAYFNHACLPNCLWEFDYKGYMVARAEEDIMEGDELTFSYVGQLFMEERKQMLDPYGFECRCTQCLAGTQSTPTVPPSPQRDTGRERERERERGERERERVCVCVC